MLSPLYQLAQNNEERVGVLVFIAKWMLLVHRVLPRRFLRFLGGDTALRMQGTTYFVDIEADETFALREIYIDRLYDRLPEFVPNVGWIVLDVGANVGV